MESEADVEGARRRRGDPADVRAVVVAPSELVRLGLGRFIRGAGMQVVLSATDLSDAQGFLQRAPADVVLIDISSSPAALDALRLLVRSVTAPVVVLVQAADTPSLLEALAAGVRGCVPADASEDEVLRGIAAAIRDERFVSGALVKRLTRELGRSSEPRAEARPKLTMREREVLELITRGWDNAQIARGLYLSPATVKHHVATTFAKLGVDNRVQAAVRAVREELVDPPED